MDANASQAAKRHRYPRLRRRFAEFNQDAVQPTPEQTAQYLIWEANVEADYERWLATKRLERRSPPARKAPRARSRRRATARKASSSDGSPEPSDPAERARSLLNERAARLSEIRELLTRRHPSAPALQDEERRI